jgi:ADP-ribose pyrophosphatase YjhB (NUDIX family)
MANTGKMISFEIGDVRFNCRVVAVILDRDERRVLLHRASFEDFWSLPGGRIEIGEASIEALKREMREELSVEIEVDRLLWVSEEFFEYMSTKWHGIGLYFLVRLPADCPIYEHDSWSGIEEFVEDIFVPEDLRAESNKLELVFQWYDREALHELTLYPPFLQEALKRLPEAAQHVIRYE